MMKNSILELTRIVQAVTLCGSPEEQVNLIVESIAHVMQVDVCSLYMTNMQGDQVLMASKGLASGAVGKVMLPQGKGLVGLVVDGRHPVNLADADKHPAYYYVRETHEERFCSFCGVPLVNAGKVIGVLVVQGRNARLLSVEEEAFLVTLASQLALLVANQPLWLAVSQYSTLRLEGVKGAPGVGIGKLQLCDHGELYAVPDASCEDVEAELNNWRLLLAQVRAEIDRERQSLGSELSGSVASIFDAYQMLLADQSLLDSVEDGIRSGNSLSGALRQAIQHFSELFLAMDDPYLRARHEDIHHLGNKLFNVWRGTEQLLPQKQGPVVLVGQQISVSDIARVPVGQLAGIACFGGSSLSHTAVLANAMGVPAVMGLGAIKGIQENSTLIVDGNQGQVIFNPTEAVEAEFDKLVKEDRLLSSELQKLRDEPALTTDGELVCLYTNTGLLADISPGLKNGAQGVGLYRTEIPFMIHDTFPSEDEQMHVYRQVLSAYRGKPVYLRTLDIGGDKQLPYFPIIEENPALGWRGIRFCLDNSPLLMTQVRAMIRAAEGLDNLHLLLPMVSSSGELRAFGELLDSACQQLRDEGLDFVRPKVGIMVEVPAAISQLSFWADKIDFISIGSNDLSQYLLALDRNNARVSKHYDHIHPAVLHEVKRVIDIASHLQLPLSLCGEMASDPAAVVLLVGMGVRTLSMSAAKLPRIKWLIRSLSAADAKLVLAQALRMDDVQAIRAMVQEYIQRLGLKGLVN